MALLLFEFRMEARLQVLGQSRQEAKISILLFTFLGVSAKWFVDTLLQFSL